MPIPAEFINVITQGGFHAVLVVILLVIGRSVLTSLRAALDRNTRAITVLVLSMHPNPQSPFHKVAHEIELETARADKKKEREE